MTMKKNFLFHNMILVMLLVLASCSGGSKMDKLLKHVPDNVDFVAVGDVKQIVESAGGSIDKGRIKLPNYLSDIMDSSDSDGFDEFNTFIKDAGIDLDVCAVTGSFENGPILIFSVNDKKKFINAIDNEGYSEKDDDNGLTIYSKKVYESDYSSDYDHYAYIGIKDEIAYWIPDVWVGSDFKPARAIERLIDGAAEASFADTPFAGFITSGNAAGLYVKLPRELRNELKKAGVPSSLANFYNGAICMHGTLENESLTIEAKLFDEDGNPQDMKDFDKFIDINARISEDALKYMGKDEAMIAAVSLKNIDWDEYLNLAAKTAGLSRSDRTYMQAVKGYLEKIDGTVAFGLGVTNGIESFFNIEVGNDEFSQVAFTMVISTKEGKANNFMNDLKDLLNTMELPYDGTSKGFSLEIPGSEATLYAQAEDGKYIVISNHKISKNSDNEVVKSFDFADYISAWVVTLNKNDRLMRDLEIKNDVQLSLSSNAKDCEATLKLQVKGGADGIIAKVAKIIIDIIDNEDSFAKKYDDFREDYYRTHSRYDDYDGYTVDTIAVEEAVAIIDSIY